MGIENSEGDLEIRRSPWQSVFFLRYVNPIYLFFLFRKDRHREKANINQELAVEMSNVVDNLSVSEKQKLTIKIGDSTITPQQSFIYFFSSLDLCYVNPVIFKIKFVDMYSRRGEEGLEEFVNSKESGQVAISKFGSNFMPLTAKREYRPNLYTYKSKYEKRMICLACCCQKLRRFSRCIFSGLGVY